MFLNLEKLKLLKLRKEESKWMLFTNLIFYSKRHGLVNVPAGFTTDLTSTPKAVWGWLPPDGPYMAAAIIHDYLYSKYSALTITRIEADNIFKEAMESLNINNDKMNLLYYGTRVFGESHWEH